ncbi:thymidine kinase [Acaricomes phytoseiuli]|uniref:thymidine kinase n=1 Tax=Acaricomes phytoseiuli TaxID=291968 RepID=UPI00037A2829|nr:thymidine kinase [Acaricomes phytoseiuli]MCW1249122.1 thymidine kinase [Acaricomes phytoseiuli]
MAELIFYSGTMDSGKSTLALQLDHNHSVRGRAGLLFSCHDRAGDAQISSRLGLRTDAIEVLPESDFWSTVVQYRMDGAPVHYLICDEAQFYTPEQVDQLARIVDEMDIDVFAFGITADFRARLFPGSQRLIELADRVRPLQVESLCWCGQRATHNARTVGGTMVVEGSQVMVGDINDGSTVELSYETLCRKHYMRRVTKAGSMQMLEQDQLLPWEPSAKPELGQSD